MITTEKIKELILPVIAEDHMILVDLHIGPGNSIRLVLDSFSGVSIDHCVKITRLIESHFDRNVEDYDLEVSSYSISEPFILPLHFIKNTGKMIEVYLKNGKSLKGLLKAVDSNENELHHIEILITKKVQLEGKKKKMEVEEIMKLTGDEIQKAKLLFDI